jgi:hypothetical protein
MWAYLSQGLETQDIEELEQHLGVCQRCCGELEFSRQLREKVADADAQPMPAHTRARIDDLLRGRKVPPGGQA